MLRNAGITGIATEFGVESSARMPSTEDSIL
jgi:hypothetical protein